MQAETGVVEAAPFPVPSKTGAKTVGVQLKPGVLKRSFYGTFPVAFIHNFVATALTGLTPFLLVSTLALNRADLGKVQGTLKTMSEIGYLLIAPLIGALADKYGRRPMLILCFAVGSLSCLGIAYSHVIASALGVPPLVLLYIFRTIFGTLFVVAMLYVVLLGDYSAFSARGKALAIAGMLAGFGSVIAQESMRSATRFSAPMLHVLLSVVPILGIGLVLLLVRDYAGQDRRRLGQRVDWGLVKRSLQTEAGLRVAYVAAFMARADVTILTAYTIAWTVTAGMAQRMTAGQATAAGGRILFVSLVPNLLFLPLWGWLADRWGRIQTLLLALLISTVAFMCIGFLSSPFSIWMKVFLFFAGYGAGGVLILNSALVNDLAPRTRIATLAAGLSSMGALGIILIVTAAGFLFDWTKLGLIQRGSPFLLTGLADGLALVYGLIKFREISHRYEELKRTEE